MYKLSVKCFTLFLVIAFLFCQLAPINTVTAATYYVDDANGHDDANGSFGHPWKTLSRVHDVNMYWNANLVGHYPSGDYTSYPNPNAGDTVYYYNGNYGTFREVSGDNGVWTVIHNTNWITHKNMPGHYPEFNNIYISNTYNGQTGESYLKFEGIKINDGAFIQRTNYIWFEHCNITTIPVTGITGIYAPYYNAGHNMGLNISDGNYLTVQNCDIHGADTGIYIPRYTGNQFNHININHNTVHACGFIGIISVANNDTNISDNYVYDIDNRRRQWAILGTKSGTFRVGEEVIQAGSNAHGIFDSDIGYAITVYPTTTELFEGSNTDNPTLAGVITGQTSHATLTPGGGGIDARSDGISVAITAVGISCKDVVVSRNKVIRERPFQAAAIKMAADPMSNVTIENNVCRGLFTWANLYGNVNVNNNVFYGNAYMQMWYISPTDYLTTFVIDNMYNNIFTQFFQQTPDISPYYTRVINHGNNIFGNNPNGTGGLSYPFAANNTELVNYNINSLFVNAANNDFNLAPTAVAAIDKGNQTYAPLTDIVGKTRVGAPDIGCYEYTDSQSPPPPPVNQAPNADAGSDPPPFIDSDNNGSEQVTLDGSGSTDDGNIVSYEWTVDGNETNKITSVNPTVTLTLPVGRHTITLKVTDDGGLTDEDTVVITVEGLIGYWKFNEGSGVLANDSSVIGNAGHLINGPAWTTQGEISFDGNNDTVEITTTELSANRGTIALWAYPDAFSKSKHSLFGHILSQSNRIQLYCNAAGSLNVGIGSNVVSSNIQNLNPHEWYHIALVWDQGSYRVFVDGVTKVVGTYAGLSSLQSYADIGNSGNRSARTEGFDGIIDEVRLYNRPLSATEIADIALVFLPIGDKSTAEGEELSFTVRTKSGSNTDISDNNLPSMPYLASNLFRWTPDYDDAGVYEVEFTAPHGGSVDFETITVTVTDSQQEGPVGYWRFDDIIGDIAYDSSTYTNDGILLNGLTWDSGRINGALAFSVSNDLVEIQTTGFNPHSGTIAMWVYPQRQTLSMHYLFGHAVNGLTDRLQLYLKYGNLCLGLGDSHETRMNIQQLYNNQWYHIALTWGNATYNVYVNGLLMASGTYSGLSAFTTNADIGNNGITRDKAFNGKIDEVRVYNRALNALEIAQLAN